MEMRHKHQSTGTRPQVGCNRTAMGSPIAQHRLAVQEGNNKAGGCRSTGIFGVPKVQPHASTSKGAPRGARYRCSEGKRCEGGALQIGHWTVRCRPPPPLLPPCHGHTHIELLQEDTFSLAWERNTPTSTLRGHRREQRSAAQRGTRRSRGEQRIRGRCLLLPSCTALTLATRVWPTAPLLSKLHDPVGVAE